MCERKRAAKRDRREQTCAASGVSKSVASPASPVAFPISPGKASISSAYSSYSDLAVPGVCSQNLMEEENGYMMSDEEEDEEADNMDVVSEDFRGRDDPNKTVSMGEETPPPVQYLNQTTSLIVLVGNQNNNCYCLFWFCFLPVNEASKVFHLQHGFHFEFPEHEIFFDELVYIPKPWAHNL